MVFFNQVQEKIEIVDSEILILNICIKHNDFWEDDGFLLFLGKDKKYMNKSINVITI